MNERFNYQLEKLNEFIIGLFFGMNLTNKVIRIKAEIKLKDYIKNFLNKSF
jgi:hypothetical protein